MFDGSHCSFEIRSYIRFHRISAEHRYKKLSVIGRFFLKVLSSNKHLRPDNKHQHMQVRKINMSDSDRDEDEIIAIKRAMVIYFILLV